MQVFISLRTWKVHTGDTPAVCAWIQLNYTLMQFQGPEGIYAPILYLYVYDVSRKC